MEKTKAVTNVRFGSIDVDLPFNERDEHHFIDLEMNENLCLRFHPEDFSRFVDEVWECWKWIEEEHPEIVEEME